jgi:hypothetical protein
VRSGLVGLGAVRSGAAWQVRFNQKGGKMKTKRIVITLTEEEHTEIAVFCRKNKVFIKDLGKQAIKEKMAKEQGL